MAADSEKLPIVRLWHVVGGLSIGTTSEPHNSLLTPPNLELEIPKTSNGGRWSNTLN